MANSHPTGLFPSQSVSNAEKASLEYGQKIGRAIESEWFKLQGISLIVKIFID